MDLLNNFLFGALPYAAFAVFLVGSIYRYRTNGFKYSSLSSQFLEGGGIYIFAVLFHWGILVVFLGHLIAFLFPGLTLSWHSSATRLIADEIVIFTFGLAVLIGLVGLFIRRVSHPRIRVVTTRMDIVIELLLLAQIVLGLWIALGYRWGYYWFASDMSPYLWSIVKFGPQIEAVGAMPWVIKAHIVGAFIILGILPFTRLVHFLVAPFHYTWRDYQQVIWYWDRKRVRDPATAWTTTRPRNT
ncbi:MAG: respiratory nitrate reductase subunit gamma [Pseudomonadota bacterium]